jgi:hypothetical protein
MNKDNVLLSAKTLFPHITEDNFVHMFCLSPSSINHYLTSTSEVVRFISIYLAVLENNQTFSDLFVLDAPLSPYSSTLSNSWNVYGGVHALLQSELKKLLLIGTHFINVDDWSENEISTKYNHVIGIVDCTEIPIIICPILLYNLK